ncbi:MAG: glycoside hydrolase family 2 protein [Candidatus Krumholzibacteriaceae bacterium]|jgi:beta-mannosidase
MNRPAFFAAERAALLAACSLLFLHASCYLSFDRSTIELRDGWEFREAPTGAWRPATVPGCVHTDLFANGLIGDPFDGTNEKDLQWIENKDWEYRTSFDAGGNFLAHRNVELEFDGLDTYADVYLNDSLLLVADNMFRRWRVSCAGALHEGKNTLRVHFHSPVSAVRERWNSLGYELPGGPRVLTRKAAYQYGWDWAPRFVTSGIWRPARLVAWDTARIADLAIIQNSVTEQSAELTARLDVESAGRRAATLTIALEDSRFESVDVDLAPGLNEVSLHFSIPKPELWWTNGLGDQHFYHVFAELRCGGDLLDWRTERIGIRTIELVRETDRAGTSFYFRLNGVPVFMKGANYVPPDSFLPRVSRDRRGRLVAGAARAGMNMLRVWGGGVYEDDDFYSLCDEFGILVWQDFMFACAMYPGDSTFLENVKQEAIDNVTRLRNHPCIALWCGNNEIDEAWHNWGWQGQFRYSATDSARIWGDYVRLFHELLPGIVRDYDPGAAYWPSSPSYGRADPRSLTEGDSHYWGVWHDGEPFEAYTKNVPQFMSEFGFQSLPSTQTIMSFARPGDLAVDSPAMLAHQKNEQGNEIIREYMDRYYRTPRDFESFAYVSQLLQAEGMKTGIEAHRRAKPYCMGSLFWQLDDCWPAASWSSIDYGGNPKALYYYARDAFGEVLVSPVIEDGMLRVYVVSDRQSPVEGPVAMELVDFSGNVIWESSHRVKVGANSSTCVFEDTAAHVLAGERSNEVVLCAEMFEGGALLSRNLLYFAPPKDLDLPPPDIREIHPVHITPTFFPRPAVPALPTEPGVRFVTLQTGVLAKNVYLSVPGCEGYFDDNYFDMLPGSTVTVRFITKEDVGNLAEKLRVMTLADTY